MLLYTVYSNYPKRGSWIERYSYVHFMGFIRVSHIDRSNLYGLYADVVIGWNENNIPPISDKVMQMNSYVL